MKACIVVGGGPSAPDHYDWMRAAALPIIAPSTMLIPLQSAGFTVDACCVFDCSHLIAFHFFGADLSGLLVHCPHVYTEGWARKREFITDGPSVLNYAVDYALSQGFDTIHLVGADFCFRDGQSHAVGVTTSYQPDPRLCLRREGVLTNVSLIHFRDALERRISTGGASFIRHGSGLPVAGVELASVGAVREECSQGAGGG